MTAKEKAAELFNKFENTLPDAVEVSKHHIVQCVLIAVDEILISVEGKYDEYWQEVKQEIEKL
jgi:hypothetical protein